MAAKPSFVLEPAVEAAAVKAVEAAAVKAAAPAAVESRRALSLTGTIQVSRYRKHVNFAVNVLAVNFWLLAVYVRVFLTFFSDFGHF